MLAEKLSASTENSYSVHETLENFNHIPVEHCPSRTVRKVSEIFVNREYWNGVLAIPVAGEMAVGMIRWKINGTERPNVRANTVESLIAKRFSYEPHHLND